MNLHHVTMTQYVGQDISGASSYCKTLPLHPEYSAAMSTRVAVVTGAAQGIGRAIALRLAKDGLDVVVNDLPSSLAKLRELVGEIEAHGRRAIAVPGDASVEADVENVVNVAVKELGGLNVFVANAGVNFVKPLVESTVEDWERLMRINGRSTFLGYRIAGKQMIAQGLGGRIIGACSIAGKKALINLGIYSATKFAVRALTQAAAAEFAEHKITVNAYAPGTIDTPMVRGMAADLKGTKHDSGGEWLNERIAGIPLKSLGTAEEVAGLVSYLASEESRYVTGQAFNINGGTIFD